MGPVRGVVAGLILALLAPNAAAIGVPLDEDAAPVAEADLFKGAMAELIEAIVATAQAASPVVDAASSPMQAAHEADASATEPPSGPQPPTDEAMVEAQTEVATATVEINMGGDTAAMALEGAAQVGIEGTGQLEAGVEWTLSAEEPLAPAAPALEVLFVLLQGAMEPPTEAPPAPPALPDVPADSPFPEAPEEPVGPALPDPDVPADPLGEPPMTPEEAEQTVEEILALIPEGDGEGPPPTLGPGLGGGSGDPLAGPLASLLETVEETLPSDMPQRHPTRLGLMSTATDEAGADGPAEEMPGMSIGPAPEPREQARTQEKIAAPAPATSSLPLIIASTTLVTAAAAAGGAWAFPAGRRWLLRVLGQLAPLALYSRVATDDVLAHPKRNLIYEFIRQNPGERLEVIRRQLNLGNGTLIHHLRILALKDLVRVRREEGMARAWPAGPAIPATEYVPRKQRQILEHLRAQPGLSQRQIARIIQTSERVVSYHVHSLKQRGLVTVERSGATHKCFPACTA